MSTIALAVKKRPTGKQVSKDLRRNGSVPGVFYISGQEPVSIVSDPLTLRPIVYTAQTKVIDLSIDGIAEAHRCILKAVDFDPITDKLVHFDLLGLTPGRKLTVIVPVKLKGTSIGVRNGGILQTVIHKVKLKCLPEDLPEVLEVDISGLEIGKSVKLKDLQKEGLEFFIKENPIVCQILPPRVSKTAAVETKKKK